MTKGTITTTRSGRPRENPSPQAIARELEAVKSDLSGIKKVLSPAFSPSRSDSSMARGPGDYPREPVTLRQASTRAGDIWAGDAEHSPQFMQDLANGTNIAELRQRSAQDAIMRAEAEARRAVVYDEVRVFCGRGGCRPSLQCHDCVGRTRTVCYGDDTEVPLQQQRSTVFSEWDHGGAAMAQQAGRDQILNSVERHHAAALAADAAAQRQANAAALAEQSEALRVRQHAERMQQRPPGESGDVLKGL
jgi:hypothetical protein